jgi:hypothetical protein
VELRTTESDEVALRALTQFAQNCADNGHSLCTSPGACHRTLESAMERADFGSNARRYDLGTHISQPGEKYGLTLTFQLWWRRDRPRSS